MLQRGLLQRPEAGLGQLVPGSVQDKAEHRRQQGSDKGHIHQHEFQTQPPDHSPSTFR